MYFRKKIGINAFTGYGILEDAVKESNVLIYSDQVFEADMKMIGTVTTAMVPAKVLSSGGQMECGKDRESFSKRKFLIDEDGDYDDAERGKQPPLGSCL